MPSKQSNHHRIAWDSVEPAPSWSTGIVFLDWMTGCGGLPQGRVVECYGPESSGKSTLGLQTASFIWRTLGLPSIYYDFEDTFDARYASSLGLSSAGLHLEKPEKLEDFFAMMDEDLTESEKAGSPKYALAIFDSVAAGRTEDDLKNAAIDNRTAGMNRARLWTHWLGTNVKRLGNTKITLLLVNQLRDYIDTNAGFMPPGLAALQPKDKTPGGRGIKFYASLRLAFEQSSEIKVKIMDPLTRTEGNVAVGKNVWLKVTKNKVAPPPWRKMRLQIRDGIGFDLAQNLLDFGQTHGIIRRDKGIWTLPGDLFATGDAVTIQAADGYSGDERMAALMRSDAGLRELLIGRTQSTLAAIEQQLTMTTEEAARALMLDPEASSEDEPVPAT